MTIRLTSILLALSLGLAACQPSISTRDGVGETQRLSFGQSVDIAAVGTRVSALRAGNGLARPLGHSAALQAAAQAHADYMAQSGNFTHTGSNGSDLSGRVRQAGYNTCFAAENLAHGQASIAQVFQDWMTSDGHRRNILAPEATQFGFARNGTYSVLVLGRSC